MIQFCLQLLGDTPLPEIQPRHLRSRMALVAQEPVLFDCSIRENVTYGLDEDVPIQQIEHAMELANITSFVGTLPQVYWKN